MKELQKNKNLILFDGVCNLCNFWVQYIIRRDDGDLFRFATLQSKIAKEISESYAIDLKETDSIILYSKDSGPKTKSDAVLEISKILGYPYKLLLVFKILPSSVRNWLYEIVARNRYKWYGKRDSCMMPTPELQNKFLV